MFVKLLPAQIPTFWETIKFGCQKADVLTPDNYQAYFNELLHALLSDKAQCFVRLNDDRKIIGVLVTRVLGNKISGNKYLLLQSAYSFDSRPQDVWIEDLKVVGVFAKEMGCKSITFETSNPRIVELALNSGFREKSRSYEFFIGGA